MIYNSTKLHYYVYADYVQYKCYCVDYGDISLWKNKAH